MNNREIKFRVWDKTYKRWIENVTIDCTSGVAITPLKNLELKNLELDSKISILQFTGLLDKNGKEIYEGDIIKFTLKNWQYQSIKSVYWGHYYLDMYPTQGWCIGENEESLNCSLNSNPDELEIVGSIFETPELLEKK